MRAGPGAGSGVRPSPRRLVDRLTRIPQAGWERFGPGVVSEIATPLMRARVGGGLLIAAAVLIAAAIAVSTPPGAQPGLLWSIVGAGVVFGAALLSVGKRLTGWMSHLAPLAITGLMCGAVLGSGGGVLALAFAALAVFAVTDAFVAFPWWQASVHLLVTIATGSVALALAGPVHAGPTVVGSGVTIVVGLTVGVLIRVAGAAEQDRLTGLLNQRGFDRALRAAIFRAGEDNHPLSLAFLDIDHFARVNEVFGHVAGDRLLVQAADAWRDGLEGPALLARWSGDRFVALLPGHTPRAAAGPVQSLRRSLPRGHTCSAGIAAWEPGDSASLLVNRAEALLYQAKRAGRDRLVTQPDIGRPTTELRNALCAGQLRAHYQSLVDLASGRVVGAEALVRWQHPERGLLGPADFLDVARTSGLIVSIDRWMLTTACRQAAAWLPEGSFTEISVNVTGPTLTAPGYVEHVRTALAESGLPARHLVLEITEDVLGAADTDIVSTLHALRDLGVRMAIDDFGTGYSSLSRLDALPIDILKIDRSFVAALVPPQADTALLRVLAALGDGLDLDLIAEGVETVHQRRCLSALGCGVGQGYLFGRPVPADEFTAALRDGRHVPTGP